MKNTAKVTGTRVLKCGISLTVYLATMSQRFLIRLLGRTERGTCVVLYYHSVPSSQSARFAEQLDTLLRTAKPIDVTSEVVRLQSGIRYVGVTFDDAFENFIDQALPELKKRNIPATVFVISDALGKEFGPVGGSEKVMSLEQLRSLPAEHVTIGSHSVTHPMMPLLSETDARAELIHSRKCLEERLGFPIMTFSFPFGGFSRGLIELCREAGYQRVFTTLPAFAFNEPNEFVVGRVRVDPTDWPLEFRLKLAGAYRWLPTAFRLKRKVFSWPFVRHLWPRQSRRQQTGDSQSRIREFTGSGEKSTSI